MHPDELIDFKRLHGAGVYGYIPKLSIYKELEEAIISIRDGNKYFLPLADIYRLLREDNRRKK
jgi:nitrogen fixation protein